jgi:hypothetical protein
VPDKVAIVSAADAGYFHLLEGLIASLHDAKLPDYFDMCVYDVGLTDKQAEILKRQNIAVLKPRLSIDSPHQALEPSWFSAVRLHAHRAWLQEAPSKGALSLPSPRWGQSLIETPVGGGHIGKAPLGPS